MATQVNSGARLPRIDSERITDPELRAILARSRELSAPTPAWYETLAHAPDMAVGYSHFWELTHRGGRIEHATKELMRLSIAQVLQCGFCSAQRSVPAIEQGLAEADVARTAQPDFGHPDPRVRAAVRFGYALASSAPDNQIDAAYRELREVFSDAEVVELVCFAAITIGGVTLARSLRIVP